MRPALCLAAITWIGCGQEALPPAAEGPEPQAFLDGAPFPVLDLALPNLPEPSRAFFAAPGGGDGGDGSRENPWTDLAQALAALEPGDRLTLLPADWIVAAVIDTPCRDGRPDAPIQVVAEPGAVLRPAPGARFVVLVRRAYWSFDGLEIVPGDSSAVAFATHGEGAHDVVLSRSHLYDGRSNAVAVGPGSARVRIVACHIHHFRRGDEDAHGVAIFPGARDVTVEGNHIHHNSGDSIQVIGPEQVPTDPLGSVPSPLPPADGAAIRANRMHHDRENAIDVKGSRRVTIAGNRLWGYRPVPSSDGEGIVVHYGALDVRIEGNHVADATVGVWIGRGTLEGRPAPATPRSVVVAGNYFEAPAGGPSIGVAVLDARDVEVAQNVVSGFATGLTFLGDEDGLGGLVIVNNLVLESRELAFRISRLSAAARLDHNAFALAAGDLRAQVGRQVSPLGELLGRMPGTVASGAARLAGNDLARIEGIDLRGRGAPWGGFLEPDIGVMKR